MLYYRKLYNLADMSEGSAGSLPVVSILIMIGNELYFSLAFPFNKIFFQSRSKIIVCPTCKIKIPTLYSHDISSTSISNSDFSLSSECKKRPRMCGETKESCGEIPADLERCVNRLRNTNPEKFQELCKMHLSFLLDFPSLEEFLSDPFMNSADVSSKNKKTFTPFSKRKSM
jgi:hypothetical protein